MRALKTNREYISRLMSINEAAAYIGQGNTKAREWLDSIGAKRKFGSRALYDRKIIDAALDNYDEMDHE